MTDPRDLAIDKSTIPVGKVSKKFSGKATVRESDHSRSPIFWGGFSLWKDSANVIWLTFPKQRILPQGVTVTRKQDVGGRDIAVAKLNPSGVASILPRPYWKSDSQPVSHVLLFRAVEKSLPRGKHKDCFEKRYKNFEAVLTRYCESDICRYTHPKEFLYGKDETARSKRDHRRFVTKDKRKRKGLMSKILVR